MKRIGKAAALLAALLLVIGITACPQKPKNELGTFKVTEFKVGGRTVVISETIGAISPKAIDFEITADASISSVVVESESENATFTGSGKTLKGELTKLPVGKKETVTFTVKSSGKKDVTLVVPITFNPDNVPFEKIYVDSGESNSAADLALADGSAEVVAKAASATLNIETKIDAESVKVSVNGAESDATQVNPKKYTFSLTGLSASPVTVKVTASAPMRKDGTYTFKVIMGQLNVAITSLKVNRESVSVSKASSAEGLSVVFDKENLVKMGMVPIEVEVSDTLTSQTCESTEGILKDSFKVTGKKLGVFAACFSNGQGKVEGQSLKAEAIVTENKVTITLKAANRKDTVLTIKLSDSNKLPFGVNIGEGEIDGQDWSGFGVSAPIILPETLKLTMFGKTASFIIYNGKSKPFAVFKQDTNKKDWIQLDTLQTQGGEAFAVKAGDILETNGTAKDGKAYILYAEAAGQGDEVEACAVKSPVHFRFPGEDKYKHSGYFVIKDAKFKDLEGIPGNKPLDFQGPTQQNPDLEHKYIDAEMKRLEEYLSMDGHKIKVKKDKLSTADKLFFVYLDMKEYTKVTVKKSSKMHSEINFTNETTTDLAKDKYLLWNMFDDVETGEKIKAFEKGKDYKYEVEVILKAGGDNPKFTVIYEVE